MQAVILAAGKSTRTYPLTVNMPKSLLPICGKPILQYTLEALEGVVEEVILIVGFGKEQVRAFCGEQFGSLKVTYIEQTEQLGTGHALVMAKEHLGDRFYLINGDDLYAPEDIKKLAEYDNALLVREVENPKIFGVVEETNGLATAFVEKPEEPKSNLANMGCYVFSKEIFDHELQESSRGEYEVVDFVTYLIEQGRAVQVIRANEYWLPVGYPWDVLRAQEFLLTDEQHYIDPSAKIDPDAYIEGPVIIGPGVIVEAHAHVHKSVLGNGCTIKSCARVAHSSLGGHCKVGEASTVCYSVLGNNIEVYDNVHMLHNLDDESTISSQVKGATVDTKRKNFGSAIGDAVALQQGSVLNPGVKVWPKCKIDGHQEVMEDVR